MSYIFWGMLEFMVHNLNYWSKCYQLDIIVCFCLTFSVVSLKTHFEHMYLGNSI